MYFGAAISDFCVCDSRVTVQLHPWRKERQWAPEASHCRQATAVSLPGTPRAVAVTWPSWRQLACLGAFRAAPEAAPRSLWGREHHGTLSESQLAPGEA